MSPWADDGAIARRGLRDDVYERILDLLMSEQLAPGTRLSIDGIARDLRVSPTPVREALIQLERTGLVEREALKGYRVAPPLEHDQVDAVFDARLIIECGAVALAAPRAEALVPALESALQGQHEAAAVLRADTSIPALSGYFVTDWHFHQLIFEHTENAFLVDMSEAVSARVHRMRQMVVSGISDADEAMAEHAAIIEAFRSGEPGAAAEAMRQHLESVRSRAHHDADVQPGVH